LKPKEPLPPSLLNLQSFVPVPLDDAMGIHHDLQAQDRVESRQLSPLDSLICENMLGDEDVFSVFEIFWDMAA